ncbi:MAG: nitroreductase/quinone reductase family protein [Chloroflexota bacterium]
MTSSLRRIFWYINKFFMVPVFRIGLGFLLGNPLSGYIMVLKVIGRKSGKIRFAPVNYAIQNGNIYCISGGRQTSDWYRNLKANPQIDVILPVGAIFGLVDEVAEPQERLLIIRQVLKNAGFAGFFEGYNPFSISDKDLAAKIGDLPLLRIRPTGVGSGASDPGGWAGIWGLVLTLALIWALLH